MTASDNRTVRTLDPLAERIHIACATMSTAPMAQTTMSKVMGQLLYQLLQLPHAAEVLFQFFLG